MLKHFTTTQTITNEASFQGMRPGQWVKHPNGARGQFLGITQQGVIVVRWQRGTKFGQQGADNRTDARQNGILRTYARNYGAK